MSLHGFFGLVVFFFIMTRGHLRIESINGWADGQYVTCRPFKGGE
jgi:hypothetical protein